MESLSRPDVPASPADRARAWITWFGVSRLVASSVAVVVVCAGAYWLVRTPPPPTEASLAMAVATTTEPDTDGGPSATTTPGAGSESPVLVHVAGSVIAPGVYVLAPGARVRDAVVAAGGPAPDADANALNLAAVVVDGSRVYVPAVGEEVVEAAPVGAGGGAEPVGPIDVNRATVEQLETLPGVGPATATAIVTERERNGPFVDVDDLDRVPGIGPAKLAGLRDLVTT
ncbi:MAG: ComEA family DNA-binding protein [Ilumatobacteraceae bacterium]